MRQLLRLILPDSNVFIYLEKRRARGFFCVWKSGKSATTEGKAVQQATVNRSTCKCMSDKEQKKGARG